MSKLVHDVEALKSWWPVAAQVALFLLAAGAFLAKVDGYEDELKAVREEFKAGMLDLQGRILQTNSSQDERSQILTAEVTRRLDEHGNRLTRLESPFFNRKDAGLTFMYAEVLVEEPEIRPLIYDKEIDELEREIMILQTLLGAKGISDLVFNRLNERLWEKQSEKQDLLLKQQVCEFDDQRRAECWAEYLTKPFP